MLVIIVVGFKRVVVSDNFEWLFWLKCDLLIWEFLWDRGWKMFGYL